VRWNDCVSSQATSASIVSDEDSVTYAELQNLGGLIATHLASRVQVTTDKFAAIYLHRSVQFFACVNGILRCGMAYIPLNTEDSGTRIERILSSAKPLFVFVSKKFSMNVDINPIDISTILQHGQKVNFDDPKISSRSLCYTIFTSGTTGTPKGVLIEHIGVNNMIDETIRLLSLTRNDRVLQFYNLAFDGSVYEYLPTFAIGALVVLWSSPIENLQTALVKHRVTIFTSTTSILRLLDPKMFPDLRAVGQAGEKLTTDIVSKWATDERRLHDCYGPTEASVFVTLQHFSFPTEDITLGPPLKNCNLYVLDNNGENVTIGAEGELHIGGICLARGYLGDEEKTRTKFFNHNRLGRIYATGDLAQVTEKKEFKILGRADNQFKINGFRVDCGEIEHAVLQCPGVNTCVVTYRDKQLIAYVQWSVKVTSRDLELGLSHVIKFNLKTQIPSYMIPHTIHSVEEIPLTLTGKVDYRALPKVHKTAKQRLPTMLGEFLCITNKHKTTCTISLDISTLVQNNRLTDIYVYQLNLSKLPLSARMEPVSNDLRTWSLSNLDLNQLFWNLVGKLDYWDSSDVYEQGWLLQCMSRFKRLKTNQLGLCFESGQCIIFFDVLDKSHILFYIELERQVMQDVHASFGRDIIICKVSNIPTLQSGETDAHHMLKVLAWLRLRYLCLSDLQQRKIYFMHLDIFSKLMPIELTRMYERQIVYGNHLIVHYDFIKDLYKIGVCFEDKHLELCIDNTRMQQVIMDATELHAQRARNPSELLFASGPPPSDEMNNSITEDYDKLQASHLDMLATYFDRSDIMTDTKLSSLLHNSLDMFSFHTWLSNKKGIKISPDKLPEYSVKEVLMQMNSSFQNETELDTCKEKSTSNIVQSACAVSNQNGIMFQCNLCIFVHLLQLMFKLLYNSVLAKLTGTEIISVHISSCTLCASQQTTLLTHQDLSCLLVNELIHVNLENFNRNDFIIALQKSLLHFPFINSRFNIKQCEDDRAMWYLQGIQKESAIVTVQHKAHIWHTAFEFVLLFMQRVYVYWFVRLVHTFRLQDNYLFRKICMYQVLFDDTIKIHVTKQGRESALIKFMISHALGDAWTHASFISYFMKCYESSLHNRSALHTANTPEVSPSLRFKALCDQKNLQNLQSVCATHEDHFITKTKNDLCEVPFTLYKLNTLLGSCTTPPSYAQYHIDFSLELAKECQHDDCLKADRLFQVAVVARATAQYKNHAISCRITTRLFLHTQGNFVESFTTTVTPKQSLMQIYAAICKSKKHFDSLLSGDQLHGERSEGATSSVVHPEVEFNTFETRWGYAHISPFVGRVSKPSLAKNEHDFFCNISGGVLLDFSSTSQSFFLYYDTLF